MTLNWSKAESEMIGVLYDMFHDTPDWENRYNIAWYVGRCMLAGFCNTPDQMRACAERYVAGKRKVTPPGTARRKREEKRRQEELAKIPAELMAAVQAVVSENEKAVQQYLGGTEKALNSLVGAVMKRYRGDPVIVKTLLEREIRGG